MFSVNLKSSFKILPFEFQLLIICSFKKYINQTKNFPNSIGKCALFQDFVNLLLLYKTNNLITRIICLVDEILLDFCCCDCFYAKNLRK